MTDRNIALDDKDDPQATPSGESAGSVNRKQVLSGSSSLGDALVGKELSQRYVITQLLGTGAMGVVYKARHKILDREVAIKVLKKEAASDETSRRRFETEAKAASSLNHPNLIAVHDFGFMDDETPFLVMDYLEGESLGAALKREKRLDALRMLAILKQVCTGLGHAHAKGLVHRDLKPNNVMLLPYAAGRDLVKVVDFGIVKPIGADQELTATGQIFGTPFYMSPEQCQGRKLDGRSDIYSLGCLVYRMISGKPPFAGDNAVATIVMHVKDPPPPFSDAALNSELLRAMAPVVYKMLAKDPAERYQTCEELRDALETVEHEHATERMNAVAPDVTATPAANAGPPLPHNEPPHKLLSPRVVIATTIGCILIAAVVVALVGTSMFEKPSAQPTAPGGSAVSSGASAAPSAGSSGAGSSDNSRPVSSSEMQKPSGLSETGSATVSGTAPVDIQPQHQSEAAHGSTGQPANTHRAGGAQATSLHHRHAAQPKPHGIKSFLKKLFN